ncbi:CDP-alcohol phosphatidyltransferase family protein [uncultured Dokdonia sp.]|uniref:CDP-alcohol phosphatidyltransferase family protein n=1 Tax=uncultured Dokdonia sp. TaxID=575653 RepID=UPI002632215F|nr:CDP-alcohol phosphatidyltransferase family protein [uncultured Dokdonia sp.]
MKHVPLALIAFRGIAAFVIFGISFAFREAAVPFIMVLMYLGLISDILDGIIARKHQVATAALRRLDSQADMLFWLSIGLSTWFIYPNLILDHILEVRILLSLEVFCYVVSLLKFKKESASHAFLSKLWGLTLLAVFTSMLGFQYAGIVFYISLIVGYIAHVDRLFITLLLPEWTHDVPSSYHAYLIRKGISFKRNPYLN